LSGIKDETLVGDRLKYRSKLHILIEGKKKKYGNIPDCMAYDVHNH